MCSSIYGPNIISFQQNVPEWIIAEETLVLKQMSSVKVKHPQDHQHTSHHYPQNHQHHCVQKNHRSHPPRYHQHHPRHSNSNPRSVPPLRGSKSALVDSPRHILHQMHDKKGVNKAASTHSSAPMPRGSPSAKRGSPRQILYQMQSTNQR